MSASTPRVLSTAAALLLLLLLLQVSVGCPVWMAWASLWGLMWGGACESAADWGLA